jgi:integrase
VATGAAAPSVQPRLDALVEAWLASFASRNTRDTYRRDLDAFTAWCRASEVGALTADVASIERYRDEALAGRASASTVSRRLAALSSFYAFAAERRRRGGNPLRVVSRPASREDALRILSPDEVERLHAGAAQTAPKAAVLVALLLSEGLRLGEALALDVDGLGGWSFGRRATAAIDAHVGRRRGGPLLTSDHARRQPDGRLTRFGADFLVKRSARHGVLDGAVSCATLRRTHLANRGETSV